MPTLDPVGDATGYTTFKVQPLVLSNKSHCSATEQEHYPVDPIHNNGSLPSASDWAVKLDLAHGKFHTFRIAVLSSISQLTIMYQSERPIKSIKYLFGKGSFTSFWFFVLV